MSDLESVVEGVISAFKRQDLYAVLGLDKSASKDDVNRAYRKLALKLHPDKNIGNARAEEAFKHIARAKEVLSDDAKRALYDDGGFKAVSEDEQSSDMTFRQFLTALFSLVMYFYTSISVTGLLGYAFKKTNGPDAVPKADTPLQDPVAFSRIVMKLAFGIAAAIAVLCGVLSVERSARLQTGVSIGLSPIAGDVKQKPILVWPTVKETTSATLADVDAAWVEPAAPAYQVCWIPPPVNLTDKVRIVKAIRAYMTKHESALPAFRTDRPAVLVFASAGALHALKPPPCVAVESVERAPVVVVSEAAMGSTVYRRVHSTYTAAVLQARRRTHERRYVHP